MKRRKEQTAPPRRSSPVRIPDDEVEYSAAGYDSGLYRRSSHLEDPEDGAHDDYIFMGWQE